MTENEVEWALATIIAAARAGDQEAIEWLKSRNTDQSWRLDPRNDERQPEVAKLLKNAFNIAGVALH